MNDFEIKKIVESLPEEVKNVLNSQESYGAFNSISQKYGLNIEQAGELMDEVVFVLAGITHPDRFVKEVQKAIGIDKERSVSLAKELETEIFGPIRDRLMSLYDKDSSEKGAEENTRERSQILKEIEDPVVPQKQSSSPAGKTVIDDKLQSSVKIPQEKKEIEDEEGKADWKQPLDPYREPFQ